MLSSGSYSIRSYYSANSSSCNECIDSSSMGSQSTIYCSTNSCSKRS